MNPVAAHGVSFLECCQASNHCLSVPVSKIFNCRSADLPNGKGTDVNKTPEKFIFSVPKRLKTTNYTNLSIVFTVVSGKSVAIYQSESSPTRKE